MNKEKKPFVFETPPPARWTITEKMWPATKVIENAQHAVTGGGGHNVFTPSGITPAMIEAARDVLAYYMEPDDALPGDEAIGQALEAALNAKNAGPA